MALLCGFEKTRGFLWLSHQTLQSWSVEALSANFLYSPIVQRTSRFSLVDLILCTLCWPRFFVPESILDVPNVQ